MLPLHSSAGLTCRLLPRHMSLSVAEWHCPLLQQVSHYTTPTGLPSEDANPISQHIYTEHTQQHAPQQHQQEAEHLQGNHGQEHCSNAPRTSSQDPLIQRLLRESHAAEVAAVAFLQGQNLATRQCRPDLQGYQDQEQEALQQTKHLLPKHRARPSLLQDALRVGGLAVGAVAAAAPRRIQLAMWGAVDEVLSEHYTDTLRTLRERQQEQQEHGAHVPEQQQEHVREVREAFKQLRDIERAPEGAPPAPDVTILQKPGGLRSLGAPELAALAVKLAGRAAIAAAAKA